MPESFLNDRITLHCGDCLEVMATLPENSVDACVTDPPYHLTSIVKRFGGENAAPAQFGNDGRYKRASAGFMNKTWDGGDIAFKPETWAAVYRILKPGAHLLAFGSTRTFHRMACAIEDAGFEIRDTIAWVYGSGFPKSHDVSKGIDRAAGVEREIVGEWNMPGCGKRSEEQKYGLTNDAGIITAPATDSARQWQGWGTALKPSLEPVTLARKPLSERTVAANVLRWGTGAINVDGCRIEGRDSDQVQGEYNGSDVAVAGQRQAGKIYPQSLGRWPANLIHDGSEEVLAGFPEASPAGNGSPRSDSTSWKNCSTAGIDHIGHGDSGSAARYFYTAKADSDDRIGSKHPTVKPLDLIQYLCRLITPPKGVILDPFAGTGTTGEAAWREGFNAVLIERESEYQSDILRRMALCLAGPDERAREGMKAKLKDKPLDHGPLFGGSE